MTLTSYLEDVFFSDKQRWKTRYRGFGAFLHQTANIVSVFDAITTVYIDLFRHYTSFGKHGVISIIVTTTYYGIYDVIIIWNVKSMTSLPRIILLML